MRPSHRETGADVVVRPAELGRHRVEINRFAAQEGCHG